MCGGDNTIQGGYSVEKWIAVDLDGTLAIYDEWVSPVHIGAPIHSMVERVKAWIREGADVRIFTARIAGFNINSSEEATTEEIEEIREAIEKWCSIHIGCVLPITNKKDYGMEQLWDDKCVQVVTNIGVPITEYNELVKKPHAQSN
jgi:hypothetical protein